MYSADMNTYPLIQLANPRGFCAGVDRAIEIVERALELFGAPIYVRHEIVHNRYIVEDLKAKGAIFIEDLPDVPDGATLIFSAHGVSKAIEDEAVARGLRIFDATCPLVTKVHLEVARHAKQQREVVLIGHAGHPEVEGTMGHYDVRLGGRIHLVESVADVATLNVQDAENLAFSTQTTLSLDETQSIVEALRARFPAIASPRKDDICYATQNRQDAVKQLMQDCDLLLVVGSKTSSNSNRLREIGDRMNVPSYLIDGAEDIQAEWLVGKQCIGLTAGASAPEVLVQAVIAHLRACCDAQVLREDESARESVVFPMPRELRRDVV